MGMIQNIRDVFLGQGKAQPPREPIVGSVAPVTQASTFDNKNFTFASDMKKYDYDAILRNKQKNINELYSLADYYIDKDPIFRGIVKGVYTPFSVSDWKLVGANEATKTKYEQYYEKIHLRDLMWSVFYQYYKYENVYLYLMPDGSLITLPPYKVRISNVVRNGEPVIEYNAGSVSTDLNMNGVKAKKDWLEDEDMKERLVGYPPEVSDAIDERATWVQLNPDNTFVMQGIKEDWLRYCVPLIAACLVALSKREQIQAYESAILNLGIHSFFHMKYGNPNRDDDFGTTKPELTEMSRNAVAAMTGNSMLVTNQWAEINVVQGDTDALFQYDKYKDVNAEILSAGGISAVIVSGRADDGASFASAQVSIKTAASRIRQARQNFCELMNKVNRRLNGDMLPYGSPEKIPEFTFPPVDLENSTSFIPTFSCRRKPSETRWMRMANHATLSASSSHRWMNCPPSVMLTEHLVDHGSVYAAEGSEAHELCEYKLRQLLGMEARNPLDRPGGLQYYDTTMEDAATGYAAYVMEVLEEIRETCPDPIVMVEQRLNFSRWVKDGFGTGDALLVADGILQVIDMKYGTGVPVSAEGNSQMRLYALGALDMFSDLYDIETVRMTIYQPRLSNISTETLSRADLLEWAEQTLRPVAELAYKGEGDMNAGSWCRFCKLRTTCRKRAEANLTLAQHDFKLPPTLSDEEIAVILDQLDDLTSWAVDIREYALRAALSGTHFDGWKLVEGRSNRRYTDEAAVAQAVIDTGRDPYERKLLGITAMEKLLGKKQFVTLLGDLVERPQGKPTLAPISDKRPEMTNAKNDFADN